MRYRSHIQNLLAIINQIKSIDGIGSGIDAIKLRGVDSADYVNDADIEQFIGEHLGDYFSLLEKPVITTPSNANIPLIGLSGPVYSQNSLGFDLIDPEFSNVGVDIEISTSKSFLTIYEDLIEDRFNLFQWMPQTLEFDTTYYVRARYGVYGVKSVWSDIETFTTGPTLVVGKDPVLTINGQKGPGQVGRMPYLVTEDYENIHGSSVYQDTEFKFIKILDDTPTYSKNEVDLSDDILISGVTLDPDVGTSVITETGGGFTNAPAVYRYLTIGGLGGIYRITIDPTFLENAIYRFDFSVDHNTLDGDTVISFFGENEVTLSGGETYYNTELIKTITDLNSAFTIDLTFNGTGDINFKLKSIVRLKQDIDTDIIVSGNEAVVPPNILEPMASYIVKTRHLTNMHHTNWNGSIVKVGTEQGSIKSLAPFKELSIAGICYIGDDEVFIAGGYEKNPIDKTGNSSTQYNQGLFHYNIKTGQIRKRTAVLGNDSLECAAVWSDNDRIIVINHTTDGTTVAFKIDRDFNHTTKTTITGFPYDLSNIKLVKLNNGEILLFANNNPDNDMVVYRLNEGSNQFEYTTLVDQNSYGFGLTPFDDDRVLVIPDQGRSTTLNRNLLLDYSPQTISGIDLLPTDTPKQGTQTYGYNRFGLSHGKNFIICPVMPHKENDIFRIAILDTTNNKWYLYRNTMGCFIGTDRFMGCYCDNNTFFMVKTYFYNSTPSTHFFTLQF